MKFTKRQIWVLKYLRDNKDVWLYRRCLSGDGVLTFLSGQTVDPLVSGGYVKKVMVSEPRAYQISQAGLHVITPAPDEVVAEEINRRSKP